MNIEDHIDSSDLYRGRMNEKNPHEIEYRRQAFKLFEKGISIPKILKRIPRSRSFSSSVCMTFGIYSASSAAYLFLLSFFALLACAAPRVFSVNHFSGGGILIVADQKAYVMLSSASNLLIAHADENHVQEVIGLDFFLRV